ncbi:zinc finger BED domain-containing protein RICESLEEPER 2-like protein [Tanacetum coccineum]
MHHLSTHFDTNSGDTKMISNSENLSGDMETQGETSNANTRVESNGVLPPSMTPTATQDQTEADDGSNEVLQRKTMRLFGKIKSRIAITTDMWTANHQKKGFMAITTHFIDQNWNLQSRIMSFVYVPCPHTADVLADMLYDCLCDWNLDRKLSTITVDNCTTNDAIINNLLDKLPLSSLMMNGELFHMRCAAHILNLIVQDGLAVIGDGIDRIRDSVAFWTATPKREQKFEEAARQLEISSTKQLALDCKTRSSGGPWNAAVLDPRYKMKFLELLLPKIYGQEKASSEILTLQEFVKSLFKEYESTTPCVKVKGVQGPRVGFKKLFSDIATIASQHDDSSGTTELDNYYNEKPLPKDMKLDLLMWWKTNGSKYPTLQRIAKDILAIPVSTVASESAFSTSGRLISPHRSRLHPKTLEALMCAQSWLLNEIRETCSEETEAYCRTVEFDYDVEEESTKGSVTTSVGNA